MRYALLIASLILVALAVALADPAAWGSYDTRVDVSVSLPAEPVAVEPLPPAPLPTLIDSILHVRVAARYLEVRETHGNNRSPDIDRFNRAAGVPFGSAWCASFGSYSIQTAETEQAATVASPIYRGGVAQQYRVRQGAHASIPVSAVRSGAYLPRPGDIAGWEIVGSWGGHLGIVESCTREGGRTCCTVIEGNTSSRGAVGTVDRDGDGAYRKRRCVPITPQSSGLRLAFFTPTVWA